MSRVGDGGRHAPGSGAATAAAAPTLQHGQELDDTFAGIADENGRMSIAGFGSLLSTTSARETFPGLRNFRVRKVDGFRRVFAHTAPIFFERGIARLKTLEISSLSCEEAPGHSILVAVFDVEHSPAMVKALLGREQEFRFLAVRPQPLRKAEAPDSSDPLAVICGRWDDASYRARRCPPHEFHERYGRHGVDRVWRDDVLPCRVYLRHCVLAAQRLGPEAEASFLDETFLADRTTTVRAYLKANPEIMTELPPPSLGRRYNG